MRNAKDYLDHIVEATITDFESNPTSVRHAFLACVVTFHTVDYIGRAVGRSSAQLRQMFRSESADFGVVDDIAHALKHVSVGPRDNPKLKASQIISRPPALWDEASWDVSRWDDGEGGVTLERERSVDLLQSLRRATEFLRTKT